MTDDDYVRGLEAKARSLGLVPIGEAEGLFESVIDQIIEMCDPEEIWNCDVELVLDLNVEARAFLVVVSQIMCPPIPGVEIMCVRAHRFEAARRREGSLVSVALRSGKRVYKRTEGVMTTEKAIAKLVHDCDPVEVWECDVEMVASKYPDARHCLLVVTDGYPSPVDGCAIIPVRPARFADMREIEDSLVSVALRRGKRVYSRPA